MEPLDDITLIQKFVAGETAWLANANLRVEPVCDSVQLLAKKGEVIATAKLTAKVRSVLVRHQSKYAQAVQQALLDQGFRAAGNANAAFGKFEQLAAPIGYCPHQTNARLLWKTWRGYAHPNASDWLMFHRNQWQPVVEVNVSQSWTIVRTTTEEIILELNDTIVWACLPTVTVAAESAWKRPAASTPAVSSNFRVSTTTVGSPSKRPRIGYVSPSGAARLAQTGETGFTCSF